MAAVRLRRLGGAAAILAALLAHGCGAETRYRVLSLFFDGVPPPAGSGAAAPAAGDGATAAGAPLPGPVAAYRQHVPYAKRNCGGCHEPGTNALVARPPELCLRCHAMELEKKRYVHAPVVSGFCLLCHAPHGSKHPWLLIAEPREMCFYCHNPTDVFRNPAHREREEAPCTDCHNPHADTRFFLKAGAPPQAPS